MICSSPPPSTADCIKASSQVSDLVHSPFTTRLGTTMFEYYEKDPEHATRFAKAMDDGGYYNQ